MRSVSEPCRPCFDNPLGTHASLSWASHMDSSRNTHFFPSTFTVTSIFHCNNICIRTGHTEFQQTSVIFEQTFYSLAHAFLKDTADQSIGKIVKYIYKQEFDAFCTRFGGTYTKIGTIQRRLAWPLRKDDTQIREAFHIFCPHLSHLSLHLVHASVRWQKEDTSLHSTLRAQWSGQEEEWRCFRPPFCVEGPGR